MLTNLVKKVRKQLKIRVSSHILSTTKKQLSSFHKPEIPIKQGIYSNGTIEWE